MLNSNISLFFWDRQAIEITDLETRDPISLINEGNTTYAIVSIADSVAFSQHLDRLAIAFAYEQYDEDFTIGDSTIENINGRWHVTC